MVCANGSVYIAEMRFAWQVSSSSSMRGPPPLPLRREVSEAPPTHIHHTSVPPRPQPGRQFPKAFHALIRDTLASISVLSSHSSISYLVITCWKPCYQRVNTVTDPTLNSKNPKLFTGSEPKQKFGFGHYRYSTV
jgi:hypothetical protein